MRTRVLISAGMKFALAATKMGVEIQRLPRQNRLKKMPVLTVLPMHRDKQSKLKAKRMLSVWMVLPQILKTSIFNFENMTLDSKLSFALHCFSFINNPIYITYLSLTGLMVQI